MRPSICATAVALALALALATARLEPRRPGAVPTLLESLPASRQALGDACVGGTLLQRVRDSLLVATGAPAGVEPGVGASHVDVDSVLGGRSGVAPGRQTRPVRLRLPHRVPQGTRVLVLLEARNAAWVVNEALTLDPVKHAGLEALALASLGRDARTARGRSAWGATLVQAVTAGSEGARAAAAEEFEAESADVIAALDAPSVQSLANVAATLDGADPALASLLETLAATGDATRARDVADVVARDRSEAVLDRLPRLLGHLGADTAASLLAGHTWPGRPALERRRAAHVLARLGAASAHEELARLAAGDDPDAASEALLGLHALGDSLALEKARRTVRAHLLAARRDPPASELDQILARRTTDVLRQTPLPTGETYRLMVAGFVLLRSGGDDASWLVARLSRLDDPTVARFLERRAAEPWSLFDGRW